MAAWKLKDASDTWETVCERAYAGEPQYLTRDGVQCKVIITIVSHLDNSTIDDDLPDTYRQAAGFARRLKTNGAKSWPKTTDEIMKILREGFAYRGIADIWWRH